MLRTGSQLATQPSRVLSPCLHGQAATLSRLPQVFMRHQRRKPFLPRKQREARHDAGSNNAAAIVVHGAWADGSSWEPVIRRLQGKGVEGDRCTGSFVYALVFVLVEVASIAFEHTASSQAPERELLPACVQLIDVSPRLPERMSGNRASAPRQSHAAEEQGALWRSFCARSGLRKPNRQRGERRLRKIVPVAESEGLRYNKPRPELRLLLSFKEVIPFLNAAS